MERQEERRGSLKSKLVFNLSRKIIYRGIKKMEKIKRFFKDEEGVTAIEYGLIAALIALVIIGAVALVGTNLSKVFASVAQTITGS